MIEHEIGDPLRAFMFVDRCRRGTLGDRGTKQTCGLWHREQSGHYAGAGGFPEQCHPVRVAAECGDVVPHPGKCRKDVAQADVRIEVPAAHSGEVKKAEHPQPIVERDHHDVTLAGQSPAVIEGLAARPEHEGAAVHPDHHRFAVAGCSALGSPDIHAQAVLILRATEVEGKDRE